MGTLASSLRARDMEVNTYISELLSDHDCVIIPGLGGFIGSYQPARIHAVYHTFQPPSKKTLFNVNLRQNDGLLANHICQVENISFTEANKRVQEFTELAYQSLKSRKPILFPNVGKIYMGKEGNIQFEQDLRSNLLAESFGLQPFFAPPIRRDHNQEKPEKRLQPAREPSVLVRKALPKPLKWAAILAFPIAVAVFLSISGYDKIKSGSWNYADFLSSITQKLSPFSSDGSVSSSEIPKSNYKENAPVQEVSGNMSSSVSEQAVAGTQPAEISSSGPVRPVQQQPVTEERVCAIIIGAFRERGNAEKLVSDLNKKGTAASVFDRSPGGLYRVAAGVYHGKDEAEKMLVRIKSGPFPDAWILEK